MRLYTMREVNGNLPKQELKNVINNLYFLCKNTEDYIEYTNANYTKQTTIDTDNLKWHYWWKNEGSTNQNIGTKVVKPGQAYIVQADKTKPLIVDIGGGAGSYYVLSSISGSDNKINLKFKYVEKAIDLYGEKQYFTIPGVVGTRYYHIDGDQALNMLNSWQSLSWSRDNPTQNITSKPISDNQSIAFQNFDPISVEIFYDEEEIFIDHVIKTESGAINGQLNHSILVDLKDISRSDWEKSFPEDSVIKPQARIW